MILVDLFFNKAFVICGWEIVWVNKNLTAYLGWHLILPKRFPDTAIAHLDVLPIVGSAEKLLRGIGIATGLEGMDIPWAMFLFHVTVSAKDK